jgi:hypothetical protein
MENPIYPELNCALFKEILNSFQWILGSAFSKLTNFMLVIQIYLIFFKSRNPHDSDGPKGTMYLYNCMYGNKDKTRKEA